MTIKTAVPEDKYEWDAFVERHYPPVGAFMQTWEWGEFQSDLGRKVGRYIMTEDDQWIAVFTLVHFTLPLGFRYGYVPRGPVIAAGNAADPHAVVAIFETIRTWAMKEFPYFIFLRLESPLPSLPENLNRSHFRIPDYYIQPRYNAVVSLRGTDADIAASFHPSTRSNLHRAEKRGVTVAMKTTITPEDYAAFAVMKKETIERNSGTNAYPSDAYFASLLDIIPPFDLSAPHHEKTLSLAAFYGYRENEPVSAHFVLFFGKTATYLYGASRTEHLSSKVDTYIHWTAMREMQRHGFAYYDLGGIDPARWPTLTDFKRQFRGEEMSYAGNLDIPFNKASYKLYSLFRKLKH
jgi:lipid II:glycine glycyltransferase (peptidoglycan interpeptide bridge formation enzyme)